MNDTDRQLLIEMATDIKWIKEWTVEHKKTHGTYFYYFVTVFVACVLSWFK